MSLATGAIDLYMTYKFLRILTQSFEDTPAFELGIIDAEGNILKKRNSLKTQEEKKAYTIFHRLIWKLKRILSKLPLGKTKLASYAAALWLIKEEVESAGGSRSSIEISFYNFLKETNMLPNYDGLDEQLEMFISEELLKQGKYKLRVNIPDGGVVDTDEGPDMEVGDNILVKQDTDPIDIVLGVGIYRVLHEPSGKEIIVAAEDLFRTD
jgi:hypothetical protein